MCRKEESPKEITKYVMGESLGGLLGNYYINTLLTLIFQHIYIVFIQVCLLVTLV